MAFDLEALANSAGIDSGLAKRGLGAVLKFVEDHLGKDVADKLHAAIPGGPGMVSAYEDRAKAEGGGLMGAVTKLAGNLFKGGVGEAGQLAGMLSKAGLSIDQITKFLPKAFEMLKANLPADAVEKIEALISKALGSAK